MSANLFSHSFWEKKNPGINSDICIVGGGFTAAWTAFFLSKNNPDVRITIIDAMKGSRAASTRNAGFLCYGSPSEILADIESMGEKEAINLLSLRVKGLGLIKKYVPDHTAEISYIGGREFFPPSLQSLWENTSSRLEYLNDLIEPQIGFRPYSIGKADEAFRSGNCIHIREEGVVNPAALLFFLNSEIRKRGVQIIEGTKITSIDEKQDGVKLYTESGVVFQAKKVLMATNAFTAELIPDLPEIKPARNIVCILKPSAPLELTACYHTNEGYVYYRKAGNYFLIGGGRNWFKEEEFTSSMEVRQEVVEKLVDFAKSELFHPKFKFETFMSWSGIMGVGPEKSPVFQWAGDKVLIAARLSGMGVALCPLLGQKAAMELAKQWDE